MVELKEQIRVCGIDDGPFEFGNRSARATVIATVVRIPAYLEGVLSFDVAVDGDDSTTKIGEAISRSRFKEQIKAVMTDGIALAGFNVIDIEALSKSLSMPVISVTRDRPDMESIAGALSRYFDDWKERLERISRVPLSELETENNSVFVGCAGIALDDARKLIKLSTVRGAIPEPIRMAHIIAGGIVRGESKGKA